MRSVNIIARNYFFCNKKNNCVDNFLKIFLEEKIKMTDVMKDFALHVQ
jgi:hypothetical protein